MPKQRSPPRLQTSFQPLCNLTLCTLPIPLCFWLFFYPSYFTFIWMTFFIIPIHKMGMPLDYPAYIRPTSLTSCVSKFLERIVLWRLLVFLESNSILFPVRQVSTLDGLPSTKFCFFLWRTARLTRKELRNGLRKKQNLIDGRPSRVETCLTGTKFCFFLSPFLSSFRVSRAVLQDFWPCTFLFFHQ